MLPIHSFFDYYWHTPRWPHPRHRNTHNEVMDRNSNHEEVLHFLFFLSCSFFLTKIQTCMERWSLCFAHYSLCQNHICVSLHILPVSVVYTHVFMGYLLASKRQVDELQVFFGCLLWKSSPFTMVSWYWGGVGDFNMSYLFLDTVIP